MRLLRPVQRVASVLPAAPLRRLNLNLEKLRVFWRLICDRGWISAQQLLFVTQRLDEVGRMTGGWLKDAERRVGA